MSKSTPSDKIATASSSISPRVSAYVPDLDAWSDSWMIDQPDRDIGKAIVAFLIPFIEHLISQGLGKRTIKHHVDSLWALGGEIITRINWDQSLHRHTAEQLVLQVIDEYGGPLLSNPLDPKDQKPFDCTCRKLYKFLTS